MRYSIIPQPLRITVKEGTEAFGVSSFVKIVGDESTLGARDELTRFLNDVLELYPHGGEQEIHFTLSDSTDKRGSYNISVTKNRISLSASSEEGLFYAVQTLKQLLYQCECVLPELEIYDEPRLDSRGFMLDCASHFFEKKEIFRCLDLMALHKLNEFHWHLSDDQGFRCQLECAPLLTEIGSVRSHTGLKNQEHSGYYTKADIREIVAYAHSKHIKVIPEINTPGHTVSMISAYPELSCRGKEIPVATSFGRKDDVLCIGKEGTFQFMFALFDELCETFPDGIIHIGSNGASLKRWKECPHCQRRIKEEKLSDERELEEYYFTRITEYLHKKGVEVRRRQNDSQTDFCLSLPYTALSLEDAYSLDIQNTDAIEACLWTERIPDAKRADFALLPRLGAFSEIAWSSEENRDYGRFSENMKHYYRFLYINGYAPAHIKKALPGKVRKAVRSFFQGSL